MFSNLPSLDLQTYHNTHTDQSAYKGIPILLS